MLQIEAKPLATITSVTVHKFFWQNIVCRFGVPKAITVDNGTQFDAETFKDFCDQIGTEIHFASVRHTESNGLVERANGIIMTGIMKLIVTHLVLLPLKLEHNIMSISISCDCYT
jgi:transposase InsO family protein